MFNGWKAVVVMKEIALNIEKLARLCLKEEQVDTPVVHHFGPGIYVREVKIPAGSFAIGHYQNLEHLNFFLKGRITMIHEDGSKTEMTAPMIYTAKPGRKVSFVHEDVVWLNVYPETERDIEKLEAKYLTKSIGFMEQVEINRKTKSGQFLEDQDDFNGLPRRIKFDIQDYHDFPNGSYSVKASKSLIHGRGLFSLSNFKENDFIAPVCLDSKMTMVARFINHSKQPNAKIIDGELIATKGISGCRGGYDGDELTIDYRSLEGEKWLEYTQQ